jgi:hypothetical protein
MYLQGHPQEIELILCDVAELSARVAGIREDMRIVEMRALADVLSETSEAGKPVYSNDKQRDVALTARLFADKEYRDWQYELRTLDLERQIKLARVERLRAEWNLYLIEQQQLVTV